MTDLITFLRARLDEDEKEVHAAMLPDWGGKRHYYAFGPHRDDWGVWSFNVPPERFLAEVQAKRAILDQCQRVLDVEGWEYDDTPDLAWLVLQHLAVPYQDHPDYRQEWRP